MLHRIYHHSNSEYSLEKETMLGFMIAGCRTYREHGTTIAIPGSHKWDGDRPGGFDFWLLDFLCNMGNGVVICICLASGKEAKHP